MGTHDGLMLSPAGSQLTAKPVWERWQVLQPYLDAVLVAAQRSQPLDALGIRLESWQREILQRDPSDAAEGDPVGAGWAGLIAEGLAFRALFLARFGEEALEGEWEPPPVDGPIEDCTAEAAVGLALMQELQWAIDLAIDAHDLRLARDATHFRNELGHSVGALRRIAGPATFDKAAIHARTLIRAVPESSTIWRELEDWEFLNRPKRKIPVMFRRDPRLGRILTRWEVRPRRTRELLLTVTFLAAAWWLLAFGTGGGGGSAEPPLVDGAPFRHIQVFRQATASTTSLYVQLEPRGWETMSAQDRFDTVDEIARIAEKAGYLGVHARAGQELPAGRWIKGKGVQIFATTAAAGRRRDESG